MTVSVPAQLVYSSSGDGVTSQFPYPVRVLEAGELVVALSESGVETTLVLNTDYTLSGIGDEAGVTVTLIEVPTASQTVIRYRATAAKQIVNLEDRAKNSAEAIEQQLDRMTMVDQDQDRRIGDLEDVADELDQAVDDAAASATAAATSATNAATLAGNAADSATAAAASAATIEIGTGSDLSIDPAKLLKRGDALANVTAATKADAEALTPDAAPDFIRTAGYASAGDGGGALYYSNGTTTGDLVIALSDGVTEAGYTVAKDGIDVRALGIVADGETDQTDDLVSIIGDLDTAGFRGEIFIPRHTKFSIPDVYAAADAALGLTLDDHSAINWYYSDTYKSKMIRVTYSGDAVDDDMGEMIASGHHPAFFLNNFGTAGTTSGNLRYSTILHGAGYSPIEGGGYITGLYTQVGGDGDGLWRWGIYQSTPFDIATKVQLWAAGTAYAVGDIVVTPTGQHVYECTVAGTSGAAEPDHTSGTATDGTVTWKFRQTQIDTGGQTILTVGQSAGMIRQSAEPGGSSITDTALVHPVISGGSGYLYTEIHDETSQSTSFVVPNNARLNLGKSTQAGVSAAGVTVFNTTGGNTQFFAVNGLSGGTTALLANTVDAVCTMVQFYAGAAQKGSISYDGSAIAFNTSSDKNLKEDDGLIEPATAREILRLIRVHDFHWKSSGTAAVGAFAQELYEVFPAAVTPGSPDEMFGRPDYEPWQVDYSKLVPVLVAGWQDFDARLAALESA